MPSCVMQLCLASMPAMSDKDGTLNSSTLSVLGGMTAGRRSGIRPQRYAMPFGLARAAKEIFFARGMASRVKFGVRMRIYEIPVL